MFGHNEVVGRKFFREHPEAQAGKLLVTSIFPTLQGEGPFAGVPAIFVRLALCNLACSFCDTFFDKGDWLSPWELLSRAVGLSVGGPAPDLLVVTGGEPSLQADCLARLLVENARLGLFTRVQVETNRILAADLPGGLIVVVSPKCAEAGGGPTHYLRPSPEMLERADCLKFVLSGDSALPYHEVPSWALEWRRETRQEVYVSPMAEYNHVPGQTKELYDDRLAPDMAQRTAAEKISFWEPGLLDMEKCRRNYEYAALYAVEHGLRLTVQMHLFASLP